MAADSDAKASICLPDAANRVDATKAFVSYMLTNPELGKNTARVALYMALATRYPCR